MHLLECPVPVIAARVDMHRKNVYAAIKSVNLRLGIVKADDTPANPWAEESEAEPNEVPEVPPTTPLKQVIKRRREEVGQLMTEKDDTGAYVYNSSRDISRALRGVVSPRTIRRDLAELELRWKVKPKTAFMTPDHIAKRVEMGPELLARNVDNIIFSDESLFDCNDTQRCMWQRPGEAVQPRRIEKWTAKVHGVDFRLLVILPADRIDAGKYQKMLAENLIPMLDESKVFMQDGAPAHRAKNTMAFLETNQVQTMRWPAKSPDLNPIEHMWSIMKRRIRVETKADIKELEAAIIEAWNEITQDTINDLVQFFPRQVEKMMDRKGDSATIKRHALGL